jgi:hypothetical protein
VKKLLFLSALLLLCILFAPLTPLAQGFGGQAGIGGRAAMGGGYVAAPCTGLCLVHSWGNNYASCSGVSSCNYTLASNPTSGNILIVAVDVAASVTGVTVTGSGAGCPSSFTNIGSTSGANPNEFVSYGVAAGSGSCTLTATLTGGTSNTGITGVELSGQAGSSPIDATGDSVGNTASMTTTAGNATTLANDHAVLFQATQDGYGSPTASGWTAYVNYTYDGNLGQAVPTSGTTVSATLTGLPTSGGTSTYLVVVKP